MNYHNYILAELRKEREMQLPLFPEMGHANVQCMHCQQVVEKPHFVVKHIGRSTQQFAFCDELCEQLFYLNRLRESGL